MKVAEDLGFIKFDFLGNASLSAIRAAGDGAGIDWSKITLDNAQVYEDLGEGRTAALPQFLTAGLRSLIEMMKPEKFSDLVWANAAYRPGSLGQKTPQQIIDAFRDNPDTHIVYQEDVMNLCVGLAGFTWMEADKIRKIIGKSQGAEKFGEWKEKFVTGCAKLGTLGEEEAGEFWDKLEDFSRYAFNKAHAAAYSWNAYRIAWAKRNYPAPTFAALLNADPDATEMLLDEAPEFGVTILPPDPNLSGLTWKLESGKIRMPLTAVNHCDLRIAKAILRRRGSGFKDMADFVSKMKKIKIPEGFPASLYSGKLPGEDFPLELRSGKRKFSKAFRDEIRACDKCDLRLGCKAPVPPETGDTNILIIGEAPGAQEDRRGRPFVGRSGDLLMGLLKEHGVYRDNLTITNSVHCKPSSGVAYDESECHWVFEEINLLLPPLILAVGRKAYIKLGGKGGIMKANGTVFQYGWSKVVACIHPAAVLRNPNLLPEMDRAIRKFSRLYKILASQSKEKKDGPKTGSKNRGRGKRNTAPVLKREGAGDQPR
jgi:DNA polymerase-3 subunit alpha